MKKLLFILSIASVGFMVGCQPGDNENPQPVPSEKKVVKITSTKADQNTITNLTYDANGRLTTSKVEGAAENTTYSYNSAGDLVKMETMGNNHRVIFEVTYTNGVPEKSTLKYYDGDQMYNESEYTYTVENGLVTRIVEKLEDTPWLISVITYSGANVAKIETSHVTGDPNFNETVEYSYGSKKNAYSQSGFKFLLDAKGLTLPFFAKNEIMNEKHLGNIDHTYDLMYSYTYDSAGYPLTATVVRTGLLQSSINFKFDYQ